uniref:Flocculation protein FLO11-like n=1 Tax=Cucumis melo TaxID=3656 RepID=A0A9I9D1X4_CUCME
MDSSPPKNTLPALGRCYKSIPLRRPFKQVCRLINIDEPNLTSPSASPIQSLHTSTLSCYTPLITIKIEMSDASPPQFSQPSTSSSISDSNSSNGDDSMVLFKLLNHFKKGDQSGQSSILATAAKGMTSSVPTSPTPLVRHTSSGVTNLTTDR